MSRSGSVGQAEGPRSGDDGSVSVEIVFETHSVSVDNEREIATGWRHGELSESGRRLAAELGRRHRREPPAAVFTSDLGRAVETAQIAFGNTGVPIYLDARLRECDYGDLTGMPVSRLDAERAGRVTEPFPGGESYRQVVGRVQDFLRDLAAGHTGQRIVVIGHAATRFAFDQLLGGKVLEDVVVAPFDWREGWRYVLDEPPEAATV